MNIAFIDGADIEYDITTPYKEPIGGTQSAVCYLIEALKVRGINCWLFNTRKVSKIINTVPHLPISIITTHLIASLDLDVCIVVNNALQSSNIKTFLDVKTLLISWNHCNFDHPSVCNLKDKEFIDLYDSFVMVSHWQKEQYIQAYQIDPDKVKVISNAISPFFENLFPENQSILDHKPDSALAAYTSTPFRGLRLLVDLFPRIKESVPEFNLNVFSSMVLYKNSIDEDIEKFGDLYSTCQLTDGINYFGVLPQSELAKELKKTSFLFYPSTFAETSCIAVLEAMAAGCLIVTSDLGALPETTAGYAQLVLLGEDWNKFCQNYCATCINALNSRTDIDNSAILEEHLRKQVNFINENYTWQKRATEWIRFIEELSQNLTLQMRTIDRLERKCKYYLNADNFQAILQLCDTSEFEQSLIQCKTIIVYWGIALILSDQESEAFLMWSSYLSQLEIDEQQYVSQIWSEILLTEALLQADKTNFVNALTLLSYAKDLSSENFEIILNSLLFAIKANYQLDELDIYFSDATNAIVEVRELLENQVSLVHACLEAALKYCPGSTSTQEFVAACIKHHQKISQLLPSIRSLIISGDTAISSKYIKMFLEINPDQWDAHYHAVRICREIGDIKSCEIYLKSLENLSKTDEQKIVYEFAFLYSLAYFLKNIENLESIYLKLKNSLSKNFAQSNLNFNYLTLSRLLGFEFAASHILDTYPDTIPIQQKIGSAFLTSIRSLPENKDFREAQLNSRVTPHEKIKLGFLGSVFRNHPVGYQVRSFIRYVDREKFEINIYSSVDADERNSQTFWFKSIADKFFSCMEYGSTIASEIKHDQVDILIDLDSITWDLSLLTLSLKPAPIQLTWLGYNVSGIPEIDYFLVDSFILPDNAQDYYQEKLWRLPHAYVALDGLETGNPTINYDSLEIPASAVIYTTTQRASKFRTEILSLNARILANVKDSYYIIKYWNGEKQFEERCLSILADYSISSERIKFMQMENSDTHRANLALADVVLDTYPYNGGTTTLEALWSEVPLVTLVGNQFVSRHSYTFLMNAGVTEGIAWTEEEYVEWGIRLGRDEELRKKVSWKLKQAKKHAPLWNAPKFAKEMESALQAMWHHYVTGKMIIPEGHRVG